MTAVDVNGVSIEYEVFGDGEPLLCIAGLGMQLTGWPPVWAERWNARGFQVIAVDNRDIGLSSKTVGPAPTVRALLGALISPRLARSPYQLGDMADDAAAVLDHLGIASAHVLGVSMGGMISQELAIRHPQRVRSLTSVMSNTGDRRNGKPSPGLLLKAARLLPRNGQNTVDGTVEMFRLISGPFFDEAETRALVEAGFARSTDAVGTRRQLLAIASSPDRTPALRRLKVPTLVIHGLLDRLVRPSGGIATAKAVPGSRLLTFPDMAHDLPRHRLDEVIEAVADNAARAEGGDIAD